MLNILSETKNPKKVQPHLKKCFQGITKLEFNDNMDILKILSSEGEEIILNQCISTKDARESVDKWLLQVFFFKKFKDNILTYYNEFLMFFLIVRRTNGYIN